MKCLFKCCAVVVAFASSAMAQSQATPEALLRAVSVADLVGKPVTGADWDHVATVEDVLLGRDTGEIDFVVLRVPATGRSVALPWSSVSITPGGGVHLEASAAQVAAAPSWRSYEPSTPSRSTAAFTRARTPSQESEQRLRSQGLRPEHYVAGQVTGTVTAPLEDTGRHVLVVVDDQGESVTVDLGDECLLDALPLTIEPGDTLRVTGASVDDVNNHFVASAILLGTETVDLPEAEARCRAERLAVGE